MHVYLIQLSLLVALVQLLVVSCINMLWASIFAKECPNQHLYMLLLHYVNRNKSKTRRRTFHE